MSKESFGSSCDLYMSLLELYMCLGFTPKVLHVPKGYMALELNFVSARTIKRHHHQCNGVPV
jgi:hypothetical protein